MRFLASEGAWAGVGELPSFAFLRESLLSSSVLDSFHKLVTTPVFHFVFLELSTAVESSTLSFEKEATEATGKNPCLQDSSLPPLPCL